MRRMGLAPRRIATDWRRPYLRACVCECVGVHVWVWVPSKGNWGTLPSPSGLPDILSMARGSGRACVCMRAHIQARLFVCVCVCVCA